MDRSDEVSGTVESKDFSIWTYEYFVDKESGTEKVHVTGVRSSTGVENYFYGEDGYKEALAWLAAMDLIGL